MARGSEEAEHAGARRRHCADPAYCPCLNYDDLSGQRCEEDSFEEFYPDMSDCASFLNCTGGCIEKVLVRRINISYVKNNIFMFPFLSAKKTICTAWRMSGAVIQLRLTAEPDLVTISYIQTDVTTNHRHHPKEFKQKYLAHTKQI